MQISKLFPALCAFAVGASLVSVRAADDNAAQAAARAALFSKLGDLEAADSQTPTNPVVVNADSANVQKPAEPVQPTNPPPVAMQPAIVATEPVAPAPVAAPTNSVVAAPTSVETAPAVTPAAPVELTKEQQLQVLLQKYEADQITPAEYHTERAKIIGEP